MSRCQLVFNKHTSVIGLISVLLAIIPLYMVLTHNKWTILLAVFNVY